MNRNKFVKLLIALGFALAALLFPFEVFDISINPVEQRVVAMFVLAALLWIFEPIPIWSTSILVIVTMLFTISNKGLKFLILDDNGEKFKNLLDSRALMATWADPVIMLFLGGFFLAAAATKFKLDTNIARVIIKPFGKKPENVLLGLLMVVAIFSMFMSNTATAAMFLAILAPVLAVFKDDDKARIAFALAIPIGANLGGMGTPIGTPPNAIAVKGLADLGYHISFGQWMLFAVPFMIVMLLFSWFLLVKFFPPTAKSIELEIGGSFLKTAHAKIVYVTFTITILCWMFGDFVGLDSNVVAMIPIAVFSVTGVITPKDMGGMAWDVLWLVAGGFALGLGLQGTGLATNLIHEIPFSSLHVLLIVIVASSIAFLMSTFMSNSATAALMVPIVAAVAASLIASGVDMTSVGGVPGIIVTIALTCSLAMALPISTPPNSLAYSTGFVKTKDMAKVGLTVGLVGIVLAIAMMSLLGRIGYFDKSAPKKAVAAVVAETPVAAVPDTVQALDATEATATEAAAAEVTATPAAEEATAEQPAATPASAEATAPAPASP